MHTAPRRLLAGIGAAAIAAVGLVGCASGDPLGTTEPTSTGGGETIVIGSQDYYSNEIIAELYAQALEAGGYTVQRDFRIGSREVYMPEIESGAIDLFPEYTGNTLQYFDPDATATTPEDVYAALDGVLPDGIRALAQSDASDQDSYNVTQAFSDEYGVTSLADLSGIDKEIVLGGNSEIEDRPYGPKGLKAAYGIDVTVQPIEDSGGPLTIKALQDGDVDMADVYSADPNILTAGLVTLDDPEGLFLSSNVVPLASGKVDDAAAAIIDEVSAALTADDLIALNAESVNDQRNADDIAADWLAEKGLV